jgi:hypothetical protein
MSVRARERACVQGTDRDRETGTETETEIERHTDTDTQILERFPAAESSMTQGIQRSDGGPLCTYVCVSV